MDVANQGLASIRHTHTVSAVLNAGTRRRTPADSDHREQTATPGHQRPEAEDPDSDNILVWLAGTFAERGSETASTDPARGQASPVSWQRVRPRGPGTRVRTRVRRRLGGRRIAPQPSSRVRPRGLRFRFACLP